MSSASDSPTRPTPLRDKHLELGARLVPFAGWEMPVQFSGIVPEHLAVRERVGVFDISHMGKVRVQGPAALDWLNGLLTNNVAKLEPGVGQYTFMLNEEGGVIDDLILYRTGEEAFFLVVNASKTDEDLDWMRAHAKDGVSIEFIDSPGGLAVQGPMAVEVFEKILGAQGNEIPSRNGIAEFETDLGPVIICRTGYTGEDGFELFASSEAISAWNQKILDAGATPCGLGSRDTLRLEACLPLNGNDLSPEHTPLEAGLGFFVDLKKGDFIGRDALARQKEEGLKRRLTAIQLVGKAPPPRSHYSILKDGKTIGEICSGALSPSLSIGIALAYLPLEFAKAGTPVEIEVRGKTFPAEVIKKPFLKR